MTALALLEEGGPLDEAELREELSGNLCRCTGYQSIVDGVRWRPSCGGSIGEASWPPRGRRPRRGGV